MTALDPGPGLQDFEPFGTTHAVTVAVCLAGIVAAILAGRRLSRTGRELTLRRALGVAGLAYWLVSNAYYLLWPGRFDPSDSFPLHICDLANLAAPLAMMLRRRWLETLVYFWGLALCTQGFITPVVTVSPRHIEFWLFWLTHTQIIGTAAYLVVVARYRPRFRDLAVAVACGLAYIALILPFDVATGLNYGYVGNRLAEQKTIVHALGSWPGRALIICGVAILALILVWIPWPVLRHLTRQKHGQAPGR